MKLNFEGSRAREGSRGRLSGEGGRGAGRGAGPRSPREFLAGAGLALWMGIAQGCTWTLLPAVSVSPPVETRVPDAASIEVPEGYRVGVVATGLTFPTGIAVDGAGEVYVVEAGYSYGEVWTTPRLLHLAGDGSWEVVASGEDGPWTGVDAAGAALFVVEGGLVRGGSVLRVDNGVVTTLVEDLPGHGDHHTDGPVVGPDGWVYFGQGTATNSGVVGTDNADYGWLAKRPAYHDVPCADVHVSGQSWRTPDPLTEDPRDEAVTGPFAPFGTTRAAGELVKGAVPCTGAVMRVRPEGGPPELVAWGFRNPFGLAFAPDGALYVTDNLYDERGSRPIFGAGDVLWRVEPGRWYGWPDYAAGEPVASRRFDRLFQKRARKLLLDPPGTPPPPVATFAVHASANGLAFAPPRFGYAGEAFVAELGDMAPAVGKVMAPVGRRVVRVDPTTGIVRAFAVTAEGAREGSGLERPVDVAFSPDGRDLYVLDFGVLAMEGGEPRPAPGTGTVWRISREDAPRVDAGEAW